MLTIFVIVTQYWCEIEIDAHTGTLVERASVQITNYTTTILINNAPTKALTSRNSPRSGISHVTRV